MKRLFMSLPITFLIIIFMSMTIPSIATAMNQPSSLFTELSNGCPSVIAEEAIVQSYLLPADNITPLPQGLTLTKGTPFISPADIKVGDLVTVKIKATNSGASAINHQLSLVVNGKAISNPQQISVAPGETKDITFQFTAETSGVNTIAIGNLTGTFNAGSGSFFDSFPPYLWAFFGIVLGVIVLMVVLLVMKPKKKTGITVDQSKKATKLKGKPVKGGIQEPYPGIPGQPQRPSMTGMPEGVLFGMQPQQAMQGTVQESGAPGMQPPYQGIGQPHMQPPFQQQTQQPGLQPPFQQQARQPGMQPPFQQHQMQAPSQAAQQSPYQQGTFQSQPGMMQFGEQAGPQLPSTAASPQTGVPQFSQPSQILPGRSQMSPTPQAMPGQPPFPQGPVQTPPPMGPFGMPSTQQMPPQPIPRAPLPGQGQPPIPQGMPAMPSGVMQPPFPGGYQQAGMPKFSVSNLTITPSKVKVGEPVNISVIVSNNGMQTGKYSVVLRIGGVVENITDITLPPGASQTASFTVIKDTPGDYYVDIDGIGGFFTAIPLAPPFFTVSNFSINPERVRQGQPVTISATVTNTGELPGSHTLILRIKGLAESQQEVTLSPGKSQNVEFQIAKDTPGFYPVSLENWTGKFVVEMDWTG